MTYDDDTLMAYADGELDPQQRAAIAEAVRNDPDLAAAVARHQALRQDVFSAFAGVLDEPVPEQLRPQPAARVHDLAALRAAREASAERELREREQRALEQRERELHERELSARPNAWPRWGALAASLVVGVLAGALGSRGLGDPAQALARGADGALVAGGPLAQALDRQLAQDGVARDIRIGLSFASQDGAWCRTFQLGAASGLACREDGRWRVPVLADSPAQGGDYRQASSALPPAVLDAVDARLAGATLDPAAERAARDRDWAPPARQPR